jgi:beta-phosphoglucomutase-like phosphatase (HAD superfamily)
MIAGRFELVIFDCDGVLVDSEPIINQAHAHVLTARSRNKISWNVSAA